MFSRLGEIVRKEVVVYYCQALPRLRLEEVFKIATSLGTGGIWTET
jgi:hypothetical protein